jgi:hypothetical protein
MKAFFYCKLIFQGNDAVRLALIKTQDGYWDWLDVTETPAKRLEVNASSPGEAVEMLCYLLPKVAAIANVEAQCKVQSTENN